MGNAMGNPFTRTVKVKSAPGNPVPITVKIVRNPGPFLVKTFDINPGDEAYIPYNTVDTSYNSGRTIHAWVELGGQPAGTIDVNDHIRDCKILNLVVNQERNKVNFEPVTGNLFCRIGIAWILKSIIWPRHQIENVPMNHLNNIAIE